MITKVNDKAKKADLYAKADLEADQSKYFDESAYKGNQVTLGESAAKKGFVKGEAYENGGYAGYDKAQDYKGNQFTSDKDLSTNAKVAYQVDHSLKFRNDYKDENHRGYYKGDEFDVSYKVSDIGGGYRSDELLNKAQANAYNGGAWEGDNNEYGQFKESDYYGDTHGDKDSKYRGFNHGDYPHHLEPDNKKGGSTGHGIDGERIYDDGVGYGNNDLYNKFKGDSTPSYIGDDFGSFGHGHQRIKGENEYDKKGREFGAAFEADDNYKKKFADEAYAGIEEEAKLKSQWDQGNYRDVEAKGHNKVAQYEGDYNNAKQSHDVVYQVGHFEDLQQDFDTKAIVDEYNAGYDGSDYKGGFDADKKFGEYNDKEFAKAIDAKTYFNGYKGGDQSKGFDQDVEVKLDSAAKISDENTHGIETYPSGYQYYNPKQYNTYTNNDDPYSPYDDDNKQRRPAYAFYGQNGQQTPQTSYYKPKRDQYYQNIPQQHYQYGGYPQPRY